MYCEFAITMILLLDILICVRCTYFVVSLKDTFLDGMDKKHNFYNYFSIFFFELE